MVQSISLREVKSIFDTAITLPEERRSDYLDTACLTQEIRRRVELMLEADARGDWLNPATRVSFEEILEDAPEIELKVPDRIGRYAITRRIATGGMAAVYEAEQEHPQRTVAIKVLLQRFASHRGARRFHQEAKILGHLRHPAIAQIFDADVYREDDEELPYFVMEYVPSARSITTYAKSQNLSDRERIELFIRVCEGVHYGHQKGVIHRDLKPDNILVDETGQPKIIDFGVARVTEGDAAPITVHLGGGNIIGTLQYISPEQLSGNPQDIDTRSDVYSLGAVLYELLTGRPPVEIKGLTIPEAVRKLVEEVPTAIQQISTAIDRDLELIVMKAICNEPGQRYQSAEALAEDLRRYLARDAISVRPPSLLYQLRVAVRRHRAVAVVSVVLLLVIIASAVGSTSLFLKAEHVRAELATERDLVQAFLMDWVAASEPPFPNQPVPYHDVLKAGVLMIDDGRFSEHPLAEASMRMFFGKAFRSQRMYGDALKQYEAVVPLYEEVMGPEARETLEAKALVIGLSYSSLPNAAEGKEEMAEEMLATARRVLAPDDRLWLRITQAYAVAVQGLDAWRQSMETRLAIEGPDSVGAHFAMHVYGRSLSHVNPQEGRRYQERALKFFIQNPEDCSTFRCPEFAARQFLCLTYRDLGLLNEAEAILDPLVPYLDEYRRREKPLWLYPAQSLLFQDAVLVDQGRLVEAEALLRSDLELVREGMGEDHWVVEGLLRNLVRVLHESGRLEEARKILVDDPAFPEWVGNDEPGLVTTLLRARVLLDAGLHEIAQREAERALGHLRDESEPKADDRLIMAEVAYALGDLREAREQLDVAIDFYDEMCESIHPNRARARRLLAMILAQEGQLEAAEVVLREALALDLGFRGASSREAAKSRFHLGRFLTAIDRFDEARVELAEAERIFRASPFEEGLWLPRVAETRQQAGG